MVKEANEIDLKSEFKKALKLSKKYYGNCRIGLKEIVTYLKAPTYTGDKTNINDVFSNPLLLFHEIVEICELKKMGYKITKDIILQHPVECYKAHFIAIEKELELALDKGEIDWIKKRMEDVESYLSDPNLPHFLRKEFQRLLEKYRVTLEKESRK